MGYYSRVDCGSFKTSKSAEECERIRKQILDSKPTTIFGDLSMLKECVFTEAGDGMVYPEFDDSNGKWYGDCEEGLAILISLLIKEGESTDLYMYGEDGNQWGIRIKHREIIPLEHVWKEKKKYAQKFSKEDLVEALI